MNKFKLLSSKWNLPNVSLVGLGKKIGMDPFLHLYQGIDKIVRKGGMWSRRLTEDRKVERYIYWQQRRLAKYQAEGRTDAFWSLALRLLKRSKAFRLVALRNVRPNWYRHDEWHKVEKWMRKLNEICYRPAATFEIHRRAIPKEDGSLRWINDPGVPWRMYLWMWNLMLNYWLNPLLNENQHGHRAGKGALTAWRVILKEVLKAENIYEFDFAKFHDSINRAFLTDALLMRGVPKDVTKTLMHLSSPYAIGHDDRDKIRVKVDGWNYHHYYRGVVQGSNIAALLGLVALEELGVYDLEAGKYLGYADDGILYGGPGIRDELVHKLESRSGVKIKESKSGWVKRDGVWLKDLKFLGIRYSGIEDLMYAQTRSGKSDVMLWHKKENVTTEEWERAAKYIHPGEGSAGLGWAATKTLTHRNGFPYLGMMMSYIWQGKEKGYARWQANEKLFEVRFVKGSLLDLHGSFIKTLSEWTMDAINASSFAYLFLKKYMQANLELSTRLARRNKTTRERNSMTEDQLGGNIIIRLTRKSQTLEGREGYDMVPSRWRHPTPRMWTEKDFMHRKKDSNIFERLRESSEFNMYIGWILTHSSGVGITCRFMPRSGPSSAELKTSNGKRAKVVMRSSVSQRTAPGEGKFWK